MQLNVSVGGSIAATPAGPRPQPAAPELSQMLAPAEPVPGVTVALSPVAEAMLDGYDAARDGQGSDDPKHNPLGGQALADSMAEVAGQAEPAADRNARSLEALEASIADERDARERSLRDLQRAGRSTRGGPNELSEAEQRVVEELRARDAEVRAHELAHVAAAGGLAGAPSFSYQTGPDGKRYAIGGSVSIDTSSGRTPEETISKAQRIRSAATAPAEPSAQDRAVAGRANQMEADARAQLATERRIEQQAQLEAAAPVVEAAPGEGGVPVPQLPALELDPRDRPRAPITSGLAVLASPERRSGLSGFVGGSGAEAQLHSPPERSLESAYLQAGWSLRAS